MSEEERRRNEISMFAAMALGDDWDPDSHNKTVQGGEETSSDKPDTTSLTLAASTSSDAMDVSLDSASSFLTGASFASNNNNNTKTNNSSNNTSNNGSSKRNLLRRRQQGRRNQANATTDDGIAPQQPHRRLGFGRFTGGKDSSAKPPPNSSKSATTEPPQEERQPSQPEATAFSSGTFSFDQQKMKRTNSMEKSNLAAALAALEKDDSKTNHGGSNSNNSVGTPNPLDPAHPLVAATPGDGTAAAGAATATGPPPPHVRIPEDTASMCAEQVFLPRPLFFGPLVPPRVVRQARQMVLDAAAAKEDESNTATGSSNTAGTSGAGNDSESHGQAPCRMEDLPGSARNLVGALRVYGYGIDVLQELKDEEFWRGNPYLSTYQPLWGERERMQRIQQIQVQQRLFNRRRQRTKNQAGDDASSPIQRPSILSRSLTAPSRLHPNDKEEDGMLVTELYDDEDDDDTTEDSILHEAKSDHADYSLYPNYLIPSTGGGGGAGGDGGASSTGYSLSLSQTYSSSSQSWSPLHQTQSSQSSVNAPPNPTPPHQQQQLTANEQFSAWIRGDDDAASGLMSPRLDNAGSFVADEGSLRNAANHQSSSLDNWLRQGRATATTAATTTVGTGSIDFSEESGSVPPPTRNNNNNNNTNKKSLTEQEIFSQWALGDGTAGAGGTLTASSAGTGSDGGGSMGPFPTGGSVHSSTSSTLLGEHHANGGGSLGSTSGTPAMAAASSGEGNWSDTFRRRPPPRSNGMGDSDDDSVEHDERKKQVGLNDHLSKALASLSGDGQQPSIVDVVDESAQQQISLSAQLVAAAGGRPLTNYELTHGCVPVYGVDDPPLPVEGDLGIHETKEEQQKFHEQKRAQEIVEKFVKPNVFATTACPNPALGPDDFHSWNARVVGNQRLAPVAATTSTSAAATSTAAVTLTTSGSLASTKDATAHTASVTSSSHQPQQQPAPTQQSPQQPSQQQKQQSSSPQQQQQHSPQSSSNKQPSQQQDASHAPSEASSAKFTSQSQHSQTGQQSRNSELSPSSEQGRPPRGSFSPPHRKTSNTKRKYSSRTRYGWWNAGDSEDWPATVPKQGDKTTQQDDDASLKSPRVNLEEESSEGADVPNRLHFPPLQHSATALQAVTHLEPTPGTLRKENLPLSQMHAATSMAQSLPYLSDRPPSHRYIQIDTQGITFPPVGGEVEPMFCSLGIYNIETITTSSGASSSNNSDRSGNGGATPLPDLHRCGRVTELLNFDVFTEESVGKRCESALWPYEPSSPFAKVLNVPDQIDIDPSAGRRVGTRCGVFPLPSNLNFANLFAVLLVKKVLSEDPLDVYLKQGGCASNGKGIDLGKLRTSAEKAAQRQSAFLLPFAFGVAPLLQVFGGADNPVVPSSRAVQIPLFRFSPGLGDRQIIDHIMVMLSPREQRAGVSGGSPVAATNGGTAMLVMRNFGYLGLHQVVSASTLGRDRLVDFSGELQLRRNEDYDEEKGKRKPKKSGFTTTLPEWKPDIIAEPVEEGGRYLDGNDDFTSPGQSIRYAQELSPVRLQLSPSLRMSPPVQQSVSRGRVNGHDVEPYYHTCFCNEMLLQPRLLHNCPKANVVIKAELRELEWNESLAAYFAHLPRCGPSFHNNRRGPFLVQSVLSSCSPRGSDKHFMDEFKLKLPLDLRPPPKSRSVRIFCLVFTVYHVKMSSRSKWKRAKKMFTGDGGNGETNASRVDQIAAGFFPISRNGGCLVDDGIHDVRIVYSAQPPASHLVESGLADETTLVLVEKTEIAEGNSTSGREHSYAEDTTDGGSAAPVSDDSTNASDFVSNADDSVSRGRTTGEPISLSVRICANSSLHTQNAVLSEYLHEEEDSQRPSDLNKNAFLSKISMGKELIVEESESRTYFEAEDRLLRSTLDVVKYNVCPVTRSHGFLLRAITRLWRTLIIGTGQASLAWANPATPIPLRLHAFASILQLLGGSSLYLTKNGLSQADGTKWSIVCLGRIIALFFDEQNLFGRSSVEVFHPSFLKTTSATDNSPTRPRPSSGRRKRHVRNNFELFDAQSFKSSPERVSSGLTSSPTHKRRLSDIPKHTFDNHSHPEITSEAAVFTNPSAKKELKVDSKSDFQSALRAATAAEDDFDRPESDGSRSANAMIQAFSGPSTGNRRWMTAPSRALSTIREQDDSETDDPNSSNRDITTDLTQNGKGESPDSPTGLDSEIVLNAPKKTVKQMRIPRSRKSSTSFDFSLIEEEPAEPEVVRESSPPKAHSVPKSDDEIESAGTAFLDVIGKSIGVSTGPRTATEEQRVGSSHHRKTRSRSSIDWTLIGIGDGFAPAVIEESEDATKDFAKDQNEGLPTLKNEENKSLVLPDFSDRLISLERQSAHTARWFPFGYEVIVLQWAAILVEQRALGERVRPERGWKGDRAGESSSDGGSSSNEGIAEAATRSIGVAVAGAPLLFEVIKESLGFRVSTIFREGLERGSTWTSPPLVMLDDTLFLGLEQVISMVADACIDSRNFDSWELRQMSIDVNDSIIRFLRDMFSFLAPKIVHRLILSYLSRFVTKEGKHWQDRDSSIGLRCSWEITKLRLNAISGLVRFPELIRVNGPQMLNWSHWWSPLLSRSDFFFDEILEKYKRFRLAAFVGTEGSQQQFKNEIPGMHPHWLSEIIVDVCLLGTEHAEPQIQQRSASLLHEMFWVSSQEGNLTGQTAPIAGMHISFVWKVLSRCDYLSNFAPKSQLRKDLLPCVVYVLQSSPGNLLRALWRKLCRGLRGKGTSGKYGGFSSVRAWSFADDPSPRVPRGPVEVKEDPDVLDMFTLLNLSLRTLEYEGSEEHLEKDGTGASRENVQLWQKEFLPAESQLDALTRRKIEETEKSADSNNSSTISRRWSGHDGSLVIVNAGHQMVWELYRILSSSADGESLLNPAVRIRGGKKPVKATLPLSRLDISVFVRAASSLYLHALALRQSDVVVVRTFKVSAELIKIFGIKTFLEGVGETLQHWMRVVSLQCGARRAYVRIEATDFLELILRSTWQCFGSFFRIRVPLLAVQTEVMERIVATAASRYYRDQRRLRAEFEPFSNVSAEASLVPLWRTLDRMEKQPASQNVAFRGALIRMAEKLKKLYRAYIAARVLSFIQGSRGQDLTDDENRPARDHSTEALVRANRISILRVINASEGHSKQFLGFYATTQQRSRVAHFEAVEDALINAADVFSPTELPEHRVAWLRMLAGFHSSRRKFAEEATCHFHIHATLQQAARLHGSLWSNTPFLPWTDNIPDPVYIDGDSGETDPDYGSEYDFDDHDSHYGHPVNSFRRIFYRVANSVALNANEWDTAANQTLFCGIASALEYTSVSPWATLRDMEDQMVEEAELAGDLFLRAGIIESSRFAWNLATQFYAQKFNYAKLAIAYRNLERTVVSDVPPIDASLPQEFSATLGRFYRVWFHGGAPDELSGVEFVYRTEGSVRLDTFGQELREVIKSIIPDNTPIHLVLDGRSEERFEEGATSNFGFNRLGPAPLEPVRIKVTPLRSLFDSNSKLRGLPEWFHRYVDESFESLHHRSKSEIGRGNTRGKGSPIHASDGLDVHYREHMRSFSASVFSSGGSGSASTFGRRVDDRGSRLAFLEENELSGVDKFCFVQPKDRSRAKDWWRNAGGDYADKTLKVTQLQVAQSFPACVARQPVVHRLVYTQSPLEAGIDSVCQWCAVLFRTAVATVGMAVLGTNNDPGIGTDAVKIVADSIHSSHVKEIGLTLMRKTSESREGDTTNDLSLESYDRLSDEEIRKLQMKLARLIIVFIELLHLLIARNRQMLLDYMQERKRHETTAVSSINGSRPPGRAPSVSTTEQRSRGQRPGSSGSQDFPAPTAITAREHRGGQVVNPDPRNFHKREGSLSEYMNNRRYNHQRSQSEDQQLVSSNNVGSIGRGESAIAVQSELQRALINMVKTLYPKLQGMLQGDTPRWLKLCAQDTYFSLGTYKQTQIPIEEELCYTADSLAPAGSGFGEPLPNYDRGTGSSVPSPRGSTNGGSNHSVASRGSERLGYGLV